MIGTIMVDLLELKLFASGANLCSNLLLAVGKIGLNVPLIKTKRSWTGNITHNIRHQASEEWHVVFKI